MHVVNEAPSAYQVIDLCGNRLSEIKNFLTMYWLERDVAGSIFMQDPMSKFYYYDLEYFNVDMVVVTRQSRTCGDKQD